MGLLHHFSMLYCTVRHIIVTYVTCAAQYSYEMYICLNLTNVYEVFKYSSCYTLCQEYNFLGYIIKLRFSMA